MPEGAHRLLVIANETITAPPLLAMIRDHARARGADVLLVAPALTTRLRYWLSDEDRGIREAGDRLTASVAHLRTDGVQVDGAIGDADPLLAIDDAIRTFAPDEIIIATHPEGRSNWLERGLTAQARERFDVPIEHVEVLAADGAAVRVAESVDRAAPPVERHPRRDGLLLLLAGVLAIAGTVITALLVFTGISDTALVVWVILGDLGMKVLAFVILWVIFQRRARADRLDY
jgi:hypothetical protein